MNAGLRQLGMLDWAVAARPLEDQAVCGDLDLVQPFAQGLQTAFDSTVDCSASPQQIADRILARSFKETDDDITLIVRYHGRTNE